MPTPSVLGLPAAVTAPSALGLAHRKIPVAQFGSVAGLVAWYDFGNISTLFTDPARTTPVVNSTDPIGGVADLSGLAHHLANTGATDRPLYKTGIASWGIAEFDGSNDYLSASFTLAQPFTVFSVIRPLVTSSTNNTVYDGISSDTAEFRENGSNAYDVYSGGFITQTLPVDTSNFHSYVVVFNGNFSVIYNNAAKYAAPFFGGTAPNPNGFNLGRYGGGGRYLNFQLAEFICYGSALSDASISTVQSYLGAKWSLF